MMTKKNLIEFLKQSRMTEEMAIPVYVKHLENTLFLSGASEDEKKKMQEVLTMLKTESEGHEKMFRYLINEVEKSTQDVY